MEKQINKAQSELLDALSAHYNIIAVIDPSDSLRPEFYESQEIRYPTRDVPHVSLAGYRKITDVIDGNSTYVNSPGALEIIITKIDSMAVVRKERIYSIGFNYVKF